MKAQKIVRLLTDRGYQFYNIEASRRSPDIPPQPIPRDEVIGPPSLDCIAAADSRCRYWRMSWRRANTARIPIFLRIYQEHDTQELSKSMTAPAAPGGDPSTAPTRTRASPLTPALADLSGPTVRELSLAFRRGAARRRRESNPRRRAAESAGSAAPGGVRQGAAAAGTDAGTAAGTAADAERWLCSL
jgi:hypothetical protein